MPMSINPDHASGCFVDIAAYLGRTGLQPFAIAMPMPVNPDHASGLTDFSAYPGRISLQPSTIAVR